ncbi:hypothetical protein QBC32DRAFT_43341 [Pseudoneurospora amorphoporcata]|uniref:INO80 chromatin remodeling complex Ies1 n=1 Tax=Pseudoneurospora amorphoporcata TaxID=241081 RepID=A0AAN6P0A6_9PEZI|nr:hypothetical protein QBC32DRAFT_43341 [Pseudoneurospora amorphoporcata]
MAASPSSRAASPALSDVDIPSSPAHQPGKTSHTAASVTEDNDATMAATPEPGESRLPRGKRGRGRDDGSGTNVIGKIKHLKKDDGEPLWRKDIQYDFLKAVFDNELKVFTNSYEPDKIGKQCFADLYIDTMSRSSKTSKVLRDKLLSDREAAKGMAMVCLLVNIGRMNTTLNFFPEMRAQLRTYHAIPSLQAQQDPHAYKQLQDAPRLKSILKGGAEDRDEPNSIDAIKARATHVPRTNPVNLLFVICQQASKIAELHFPPGREFHDLIMKTNYSSTSRARAFLWLMWFYLESDFTEEGCDENPFGAGVDYGLDVANQGVPHLEEMTKEEEEAENKDPDEEIKFGLDKQKMRAKIIEADQQFMVESQTRKGGRGRGFPAGDEIGPTTGILPRIRPSKVDSDLDSIRSTPPPRALVGRHPAAFQPTTNRRGGNSLKYQIFEGSSPGGGQMLEGVVHRKPRPPTAHQLAVERNRASRVEWILDRGLRRNHHRSRKQRRVDGSIIRVVNRLDKAKEWADFSDSEDEETVNYNKQALLAGAVNYTGYGENYPFREKGYVGLCQLKDEEDDFGEEFASYSAALRRAQRRLSRWEESNDPDLGVIRPIKRPKLINGDANGDGEGHGDEDDGEGSPSKHDIDPAETEDEADIMERNARRRAYVPANKPVILRTGKINGIQRQDTADTNDADTPMDDVDDLDDDDKALLGLGDGEGEGDDVEDDADGNDDGERDAEDQEDLDDLDKTLLGMDGDSESE